MPPWRVLLLEITMEQTVTPGKVIGVIIEAQKALINKGFNDAEVILGLQELVGRVIVDVSLSEIGAAVLIKYAKEHLDSTVKAGMQIKSQHMLDNAVADAIAATTQ